MRRKALAFAFALALGGGTGAQAGTEVQRTWDGAWVFAPNKGAAGYQRLTVAELAEQLAGDPPRALVVYAHGCDGLSEISAATGRFLAQAGILMLAPDSFARESKPQSCDPTIPRGGLHRAVLGWRQDEMRFAAGKLRALAPGLPLILMGQSEGGITTATIEGIGADGRVIEGWTCHAGWPEYRGLNAPEGQPVLSLVGEGDPWFRLPVLHGDCGAFMQGRRQRSVVYRAPSHLAGKHWLSADRVVQETILDFILTITDDTEKDRGH